MTTASLLPAKTRARMLMRALVPLVKKRPKLYVIQDDRNKYSSYLYQARIQVKLPTVEICRPRDDKLFTFDDMYAIVTIRDSIESDSFCDYASIYQPGNEHPHSTGVDDPICVGDYKYVFRELLKNCDYVGLFATMCTCAGTLTMSDLGNSAWLNRESCYECGEEYHRDRLYLLEGDYYCEYCKLHCRVCRGDFPPSADFYTCTNCGDDICANCCSLCNECGDIYCDYCDCDCEKGD